MPWLTFYINNSSQSNWLTTQDPEQSGTYRVFSSQRIYLRMIEVQQELTYCFHQKSINQPDNSFIRILESSETHSLFPREIHPSAK